MKRLLKIWLFAVIGTIAFALPNSQYITQDSHYDTDEALHRPSDTRYVSLRSYEPESYDEVRGNDPRHYQSLEQHHQPSTGHYSAYQSQHHDLPQRSVYNQPEDPSYHRAQEISHHEHQHQYQSAAPQYGDQNHGSYHEPRKQLQQSSPQYEDHNQGSYSETEVKETPNYGNQGYENVQESSGPRSSHPAPAPTDPKLPLYFTMYEKRVIRDPLAKYGKGPWRYLTHGYGITYGSKEPGKVFEKGYGYIRALGRDHCKLPEHLCPPTDEKPFQYEGRKEPYFGYRPH